MKPRVAHRKTTALTLLEVLVIIVCLFVSSLFILGLINEAGWKSKAQRVNCINNLKEIGVAYKLWGGDSTANFQLHNSTARGGVKELVQRGIAYVRYQVMSNNLTTPKLLICPADINKIAATNFSTNFGNKNISYFVGVDASDVWPQTLLSGDDNFEIGDVPVKSGLLEFSTNAPIAWTTKRHKNAGNIGLADGSVWLTDDKQLVQKLIETGLATNRLAIP